MPDLNNADRGQISMLHEILNEYVCPLLNDITLSGPHLSPKIRNKLVFYEKRNKICIYFDPQRPEYFTFTRSIAFNALEREFIELLINDLYQQDVLKNNFYHAMVQAIIEHAIAKHISPENADTLYRIIQIYNQWSAETYEGSRITHTTGVYLDQNNETAANFFTLRNEDFLKTLGSSLSTLLTVGGDGNIIALETIANHQTNTDNLQNILAPIAYANVAMWADSPHKVALVLTPHGEILIFRERQVVFAKRRSRWISFPHTMVMDTITLKQISAEEKAIREAVYLTSLDMAFSGHGACLGIFWGVRKKQEGLKRVRAEMLFNSPNQSSTTKILAALVNTQNFYELPRQVRVELCALDGALIIDNRGKILTVGAILKTRGNAGGGGGRTAAAQTLVKGGIGIKISNDGYIEIHRENKPPLVFL